MYRFRRRHLFFPFFPIAAIALFSLGVMLLWNAVVPGLTGWAALTYWKAMGLLVLCKLLFSGLPGRHCGRGGGPPWAHRHAGMRMAWWRNLSEEEREQWKERRREWRDTWHNMPEEQRAKYKQAWKERCGHHGTPPPQPGPDL